jgi:hypothetical protein
MLRALLVLGCAGGYEPLSASDESLHPVRTYLQRAIPSLFPDVRRSPEVLSAERRRAQGLQLRISIRIRGAFNLRAVVQMNSATAEPRITSIERLGFRPVRMDGYRWGDAATLSTEWIRDFEAALREHVGFSGKIAHILAFRTQIEAGQNRHLIFNDGDGQLWAAVVHANVAGDRKVTYCARVE